MRIGVSVTVRLCMTFDKLRDLIIQPPESIYTSPYESVSTCGQFVMIVVVMPRVVHIS